jgi:hypothetical protein
MFLGVQGLSKLHAESLLLLLVPHLFLELSWSPNILVLRCHKYRTPDSTIILSVDTKYQKEEITQRGFERQCYSFN